MMPKFIALFFISLSACCGFEAGAQSYFTALEVGFSAGGSQYFGDLNEHYGFQTIGPAGGLYARERLNSYIALKFESSFTQVGYNDSYNTDPYDKLRNLNFKSNIVEMAVQAEFNFFAFVTGVKGRRYTPFLTGGIGAFFYDPYTTYNGTKYYLQPLGTEGQNAGYGNRRYTSTSMCFPIGAGFKYWLKGGVNLTLEIADRLTLTDYLDDVSTTYVGASSFASNPVAQALQDRSPGQVLGITGKQRGNTSSYDQYLMAMFSITFNFTSYRCPSFMKFDDDLRVRQ
jgi:hypothetical protein